MLVQELKNNNDDVFLILKRMPDNSYILAHWIGRQNLDSVMKGGNAYVQMITEKPCSKLLNSNEELIGPWDIANDWILQEWTPRVMRWGLHYLAHVLAPGVYGQMSFQQLHQRIEDKFEIKMFETEAEAEKWLLDLPA